MEERAEVKGRMDTLAVADDRFTITLEHLVELSSRAGELFESSGTDEKRQLINFVFSNLELEGKNLAFTMREPFDCSLIYLKMQIGCSTWIRTTINGVRVRCPTIRRWSNMVNKKLYIPIKIKMQILFEKFLKNTD